MFFSFFFFMTQIWGYSLVRAGFAITPGPLLVIPVAILSGRFAAKYGHRPVLVLGGIVYALGGLWFYLMAGTVPDYLGHWLPGVLFTGIGVGLILPSLAGAAVFGLPANRFGVGSAANQAIRQIGSVLGVALVIAVVGKASASIDSFRTLYMTLILAGALTSMISMRIRTMPSMRLVPQMAH
jgi:MFS family permease